MNAPRTMKEAYIAELLGDLDGLVGRVEALPGVVSAAEQRLAVTMQALTDGSDKYRMAVTAFNEQAKADLSDFLDKKAAQVNKRNDQVVARTIEEQRAAIQEIARLAFQAQASQRSDSTNSMGSRLIELGITALAASGLTASFVWLILR